MKKQIVELTTKQIIEQEKFAAKYLGLLQKEIKYGNLLNVDNVTAYATAYKLHLANANNGYVVIGVED